MNMNDKIEMLDLLARSLRDYDGARLSAELTMASYFLKKEQELKERPEVVPIPGFPGYQATRSGQIIRKSGFGALKPWWDHPERNTRYEKVAPVVDGVRRRCFVHELVALAFLGPRPEGHDIHHIDFNNHNNRADNLEYLPEAEHIAKHILHRRSNPAVGDF
jgi:hypothetical protein